jgi:hypothetical protein
LGNAVNEGFCPDNAPTRGAAAVVAGDGDEVQQSEQDGAAKT